MKNVNKSSRGINKIEKMSDADMLLAQYNEQVKSSGKHTYSETLHNDSGCCCCDLCDCGCNLFACCSGV